MKLNKNYKLNKKIQKSKHKKLKIWNYLLKKILIKCFNLILILFYLKEIRKF